MPSEATAYRVPRTAHRVPPVHDPRPPRPRSATRALALDGPLRPPAARPPGGRRSGVRGAPGGVDRGSHARRRQRPQLGRLSPLVVAGRGSDQVRAARSAARTAALRGPLLPLSVVAAARSEARAAGAYPGSQLRAHGDARAPPPRRGDRARPHAGDHSALSHRRLARRGAQPLPARHPQSAAPGRRVHRGHGMVEARARHLAGDERIGAFPTRLSSCCTSGAPSSAKTCPS